ncbi:MAG: MiaB/RimO family radical SAM methylthiotransferase [Candidatus Bathyarchaeia archaeon]
MVETKVSKIAGKAYVVCSGCPENRMDAARAEKYLVKNGWRISKNWQDADLILFNACGRSQSAARYSLKAIKEIQSQKRENQQLIVWGCLPKIDPEALKKEYDGIVSPGSELPELPQMINTSDAVNNTTANNLGAMWSLNKKDRQEFFRFRGSFVRQIYKRPALRWESYLDSRFNLVRDKDSSIFYIKISSGCQSNCAYCGIRKSRGLTKSKPVNQVVAEFQQGLQKGFKNFSLMGTDLGSYGVDFGSNLVDLLKELTSQKGDFKISLRNFNPYHMKNMLDGFVSVLKSNKIHYVEVAAESGSNRILRLMNRNYTVDEFKMLISALRKTCPQIIIRTQLIVGFPTETEQEFQETMRLLDSVVFDFVEVYQYSARPGTLAEKIKPEVSDDTKRERYLRLCKKALLNHTSRKIKNILLKKT